MSVRKTKLLVAGALGTEDEARPIMLEGGEVECVTNFKYLGSVLEANGGVGMEVGERIAKAARAFGALKGPIFNNSNLSYKTKRIVYKAVVLGVLLYGSETWTTKRDATKKMEVFHNRCLRQIVGITSAQQCPGGLPVWNGGVPGRYSYSKTTGMADHRLPIDYPRRYCLVGCLSTALHMGPE